MLSLSIKLVLAHFLGDFLFQPEKWVVHKETNKLKSKFLYWHIVVHFGALLLVLQADFKYWLGMVIIIVSHYIIDVFKLLLKSKINPRLLFGTDQLLHIIVIAIVVNIYEPYNLNIESFYSPKVLLLITNVIGVTVVSSIIMKTIISKWYLEENTSQESLENAGAYIGMLERLFIFAFIAMNYWEGIGFLLAAKSVFRFGDLSKSKDRKLTEYILIGTLISFGLAFLFGMEYKYIIELI
ncbi:membrane protein [Yeosuana aromativorans]|uniref:Membrane protein n=1 Tax=Yeosuana aromativorans TaxID=288019 RepID=A0A8J3BNK8_9FLAO|nr:DUF3307 domain-containing protein [Yeosuana aromativorans]GGK35381.1 membrane protein [Yeosuana aromativorans]